MVRETRAATRNLVRELKVLQGCVGSLSFSECHVLVELGAAGRSTVSELAEVLVLEKSTVSRLVAGLAERGLLSVETAASDRRRRTLSLTPEGKVQLDAIHAMADEQVGAAFEYLTDAEIAATQATLARYAKALRYARISGETRIRPIRPEDDPAMAAIIRAVTTEFGAVGCGFSIEDPEVDRLYETYSGNRAAYWVIEADGEVLGGAGVGPLKGADKDTCELQKMYFDPRLRGRGVAVPLIKRCLAAARDFAYARCYLETLDHMHQARALYRRLGFTDLDAPLGDTGHFKCNSWMILEL